MDILRQKGLAETEKMRLAWRCLEQRFSFWYQEYIQQVQGELGGDAGHQTQGTVTLRYGEQMNEGVILSQGGGGVTGPFALGLEVHVRVCRGRK